MDKVNKRKAVLGDDVNEQDDIWFVVVCSCDDCGHKQVFIGPFGTREQAIAAGDQSEGLCNRVEAFGFPRDVLERFLHGLVVKNEETESPEAT